MDLFGDYKLKTHQRTALIGFIILVCFLAGQFITAIIAQQFSPDIFKEIGSLKSTDVAKTNLLKIMQLFASLFSFVIPSVLIGVVVYGTWSKFLKLDKSPGLLSFILIPIFLFSITPLMNLIILWNENIQLPNSLHALEQSFKAAELSSKNMITLMVSGRSAWALITNILIIGLLPAIGEELLFRGVIQKHLGEYFKNPHIAIFIAAFLFSAIHFQFYGFIPRLILGMIFGYLVHFSGSIWTAVLAHFFNNTMAVIAIYLQNIDVITQNPDSIGTNVSDLSFVISGVLMASVCGYFLIKYYRSRNINC